MRQSKLKRFLVTAKPKTYAGADDDTSVSAPLLCGSQQLEYQKDDWLYRDVYFGMSRFTGLEFVYLNNQPKWAMSYSGGVVPGVDVDGVGEAYKFLRAALLKVPEEFPVRGPAIHSSQEYQYRMDYEGTLEAFSGKETIKLADQTVYELSFAGGSTV